MVGKSFCGLNLFPKEGVLRLSYQLAELYGRKKRGKLSFKSSSQLNIKNRVRLYYLEVLNTTLHSGVN